MDGEIPETWNEFLELLDTIQASGQQPLYFGFKDVWTCLAPWNAMACDLAPADVCQQVNRGETTFSVEYRELAEKDPSASSLCSGGYLCIQL